ncbi:aminotransferase class I/II-fold pyridoxal phosphate-dependent enzyme [Candidatus Pelagibacter sp.]|nr:aminotransferase class I/II-fold pyridoxal phosphate-dependent enzyme [Candidatus Pelagibacter sp.]
MANPNNPTGTYLNKLQLLELRKKLKKNILLVMDDAYFEYMKNKDYKSSLDLFKNKDNVVVIRTFSKNLWVSFFESWLGLWIKKNY